MLFTDWEVRLGQTFLALGSADRCFKPHLNSLKNPYKFPSLLVTKVFYWIQ